MKLLRKAPLFPIFLLAIGINVSSAETEPPTLIPLFSVVDDADFIGFSDKNQLIFVKKSLKKIIFLNSKNESTVCDLPGHFIDSDYKLNSNRDALIVRTNFLLLSKFNECVKNPLVIKSIYQEKPANNADSIEKFISDIDTTTDHYLELAMRDAGPPPVYNTFLGKIGEHVQMLKAPGAAGFGNLKIQKENGYSYNEEARPRFSKDGRYLTLNGSFDCDKRKSTVYKVETKRQLSKMQVTSIVSDKNCEDLFASIYAHDLLDTKDKNVKLLTVNNKKDSFKALIENIDNAKIIDVSNDGKLVAIQGLEKNSSRTKKIYMFKLQ